MLLLDQGFAIFKESCWSWKQTQKEETGHDYKLLDDEVECQFLQNSKSAKNVNCDTPFKVKDKQSDHSSHDQDNFH